ncbi:MAG: S1 RNA-binding domain-containing protein [Anaerolineales bacterium]|nr:S1 RNA-binding domain-containing protein [Anaerolineales bacterium]
MDTNLASVTPSSLGEIKRKQHFTGKVVKTMLAGAIVDIGVGIPGVIHISQLQKETVNRVEDVVQVGQEVEVWVRRVESKKGRIDLTMIKPLDLEWGEIKKDAVVKGKVARLEKFGAFVDIGAERPGLVHISEMTHDYIRTPGDYVKEGDEVEVKILDVDRKKKQIRLSMKALQDKPEDAVRSMVGKAVKPKEEKAKPAEVVQEEKEAPIPTAMEDAMVRAMKRTMVEGKLDPNRKKRKSGESNKDLETILARTLKNRVTTK